MVAGIAAAVLLMLSKDISNRASNTEVLKFSNLLWVAAQHCSGRTFGLLLPLVFVHLPWLLCLYNANERSESFVQNRMS